MFKFFLTLFCLYAIFAKLLISADINDTVNNIDQASYQEIIKKNVKPTVKIKTTVTKDIKNNIFLPNLKSNKTSFTKTSKLENKVDTSGQLLTITIPLPQDTVSPALAPIVNVNNSNSNSQSNLDISNIFSEPLASLGDISITKKDLFEEFCNTRAEETLAKLIGKALLEYELKQRSLEVTPEEIEKRFTEHLESILPKKNINKPSLINGLPDSEYKKRVVWCELALKKLMDHDLPVPTDEQLLIYYNDNKAGFILPEQIKITQIFISPLSPSLDNSISSKNIKVYSHDQWEKAQVLSDKAHKDLISGNNFLEVAKNYSSTPSESIWVRRGKIFRELEDVIFNLTPGSISAPIKTTMGYHIILVEEKQPRKVPEFTTIKEQIKQDYKKKRFLYYSGEFLSNLQKQAEANGKLSKIKKLTLY